jgi:hypothetical protein
MILQRGKGRPNQSANNFISLIQDKVSNFWCSITVLIKLKEIFEDNVPQLAAITLGTTLLALVPSSLHLVIKPTFHNFKLALVSTCWSRVMCLNCDFLVFGKLNLHCLGKCLILPFPWLIRIVVNSVARIIHELKNVPNNFKKIIIHTFVLIRCPCTDFLISFSG